MTELENVWHMQKYFINVKSILLWNIYDMNFKKLRNKRFQEKKKDVHAFTLH